MKQKYDEDINNAGRIGDIVGNHIHPSFRYVLSAQRIEDSFYHTVLMYMDSCKACAIGSWNLYASLF